MTSCYLAPLTPSRLCQCDQVGPNNIHTRPFFSSQEIATQRKNPGQLNCLFFSVLNMPTQIKKFKATWNLATAEP